MYDDGRYQYKYNVKRPGPGLESAQRKPSVGVHFTSRVGTRLGIEDLVHRDGWADQAYDIVCSVQRAVWVLPLSGTLPQTGTTPTTGDSTCVKSPNFLFFSRPQITRYFSPQQACRQLGSLASSSPSWPQPWCRYPQHCFLNISSRALLMNIFSDSAMIISAQCHDCCVLNPRFRLAYCTVHFPRPAFR